MQYAGRKYLNLDCEYQISRTSLFISKFRVVRKSNALNRVSFVFIHKSNALHVYRKSFAFFHEKKYFISYENELNILS